MLRQQSGIKSCCNMYHEHKLVMMFKNVTKPDETTMGQSPCRNTWQNEVADKAAKEATQLLVRNHVGIFWSFIKWELKVEMKVKWQAKCDNHANGRYAYALLVKVKFKRLWSNHIHMQFITNHAILFHITTTGLMFRIHRRVAHSAVIKDKKIVYTIYYLVKAINKRGKRSVFTWQLWMVFGDT